MHRFATILLAFLLLLPLMAAAQENLQTNALQREKERLALKDRIKRQHQQILKKCDEESVAEKERKIFLHDIKFKYRQLYQTYHIDSNDESDEYFALLKQCDSLQRHISDSILGSDVLGTNSYPFRIKEFRNTLKLKADKRQREIYRSYVRIYKTEPEVPITFNTLEEYRQYVQQLLEIIRIQNYYLESVEWLKRIETNTDSILYMLGNTGHATPYRDILRNKNFVPSFSTIKGGSLFIDTLQEFEYIQQEYLKTDAGIRELELLSDSIKRVGRKYSDLTGAFNLVRMEANVYPAFSNRDQLQAYRQNMSDYKTVYLQYLHLIYLRDTIRTNEEFLKRANSYRPTMKNSLNILSDGQRKLRGQYTWTPSFKTPSEGEIFFDEMYRLLKMQQQCLAIYDNIVTQEKYEREILELTKNYSYIRRAYNAMIDAYHRGERKYPIESQERLNNFEGYQISIVEMQEKLIETINRNPRELELQMRNARNLDEYRALIGLIE